MSPEHPSNPRSGPAEQRDSPKTPEQPGVPSNAASTPEWVVAVDPAGSDPGSCVRVCAGGTHYDLGPSLPCAGSPGGWGGLEVPPVAAAGSC